MIAYLSGKILQRGPISKKDNFFVIDVNGVGYLVFSIAKVVEKLEIGQDIEVYTYLNVREDAMDLFGFLSPEGVDLFKLLISISGVGPKSAMGILEQASIDDIRQAVVLEKPELLVTTAGMGKKTAEKIVLGLSGKVKEILKGADANIIHDDTDVIEVLTSLGFSASQIRHALQQIPKDLKSSEEKIKEVLKVLGNRK